MHFLGRTLKITVIQKQINFTGVKTKVVDAIILQWKSNRS